MTHIKQMTNADAITAIEGQISILTSQQSAITQNLDALQAALTVLQNGYTSDLTVINTAIAAAKTAADSALAPVA